MRHGEKPHILMVKIQDIKDIKNITFTLNDSHTAYWKRTKESGIPCRGDGNGHVVLQDHNKVFPFSMIEQIHQKYKAQHISYEIQIWDYQLLETIRYTILGKEEALTQPNTGSKGQTLPARLSVGCGFSRKVWTVAFMGPKY
jgi:hypothetical protein